MNEKEKRMNKNVFPVRLFVLLYFAASLLCTGCVDGFPPAAPSGANVTVHVKRDYTPYTREDPLGNEVDYYFIFIPDRNNEPAAGHL
ncbi:MAG: hypothetical protein ACYSRP_04390 [Planctomycetota bacterium]|jgi:hypothetical protein